MEKQNTQILIENYIVEICKLNFNRDKSSTFDDIKAYLEARREQNNIKSTPFQETELVPALNQLLKNDRIEMHDDPETGDCVYLYVKPEDAKDTKLLEYHEKIVFKILK